MRVVAAAGLALAALLAHPSGKIGLPIDGMTLADLRDTFSEIHNGHTHQAADIMVARGTPVHAVVTGTIRKLFVSKAGGNTVYEFDESSERCYYYAHLDRYEIALREGMHVRRGDVIAYVGSTGNADPRAPHLHFAIFELGPNREWWRGTPIDPYPELAAAVKE